MQRFFDLVFSFLALLALSPLLIPVMLILRFTGEGEVFFTQQRVGKGGETFGLLKFATMLKNSPNLGTGTVTVKNDPRVLPFGRFLRKTKINELPQLLNIVKGDMSIIGPRPQTQRCFDAFPLDAQDVIKTIRPGLSGIGSIVFRGEEDLYDDDQDPAHFYDHVIMPCKGALEAWYVEHRSVGHYFLLIGLTVLVVLSPNSQVVWRALPTLPSVPASLRGKPGFPEKEPPQA
jgi:lipopolysaccharide/colanic/teichoic acid biosynthesis glycosyltransferase